MKVIKKAVGRNWRMRCIHCRSVIEMTDDERRYFDVLYDERDDREDRTLEDRMTDPEYIPSNYMGYFDCPVCKVKKTFSKKSDTHLITIYSDGSEYVEW